MQDETPVVLNAALEQAINNLMMAAGTFVLAAQAVQREKQPDVSAVVSQALIQGGSFG
jgi:hypothetical protein